MLSLRDTKGEIISQLQKKNATTAATTSKATSRKENGEENGQGRKMNAAESENPTTMYLVMPSYAEPHKKEIKEILQQEKAKLCSNKTFQNVL